MWQPMDLGSWVTVTQGITVEQITHYTGLNTTTKTHKRQEMTFSRHCAVPCMTHDIWQHTFSGCVHKSTVLFVGATHFAKCFIWDENCDTKLQTVAGIFCEGVNQEYHSDITCRNITCKKSQEQLLVCVGNSKYIVETIGRFTSVNHCNWFINIHWLFKWKRRLPVN